MSSNQSVAKFKTAMQDFAKDVATNFHEATLLMAEEIVGNIRSAAPQGPTGHLKESIRKRDVSTDTKVSVLVIGGGQQTTKRTSAGEIYDYAVAAEFGTVKEAPEPFFYGTYRAYQAGGLQFFKETLQDTIDENNKVRALRGENFTNGAFTRSIGRRGAVVVQKAR